MPSEQHYTVRAARCPYLASQERVLAALRRLTEPLERSWARLEAARTIVLKINHVWPPPRILTVDGRRQELVDEVVIRAVFELLQERTKAKLIVADTTLMPRGIDAFSDVHFLPLLAEYGVEFVECSQPPLAEFEVPGGGLMFQRYLFHPVFQQADAVVSVATLKNHNFMGVTLTCKNLFGLCPIHPTNRPRRYFHHIIRMPYFLPDIGRVLNPCLNIIDGLVGQARREWGGEPRISETLVAGDHTIATDLCATALMGHDPYGDWPDPPFRRDGNHLRRAAEGGFGPRSLDEVDFQHDLRVPVAEFDSDQTDPREMVASWRRSMCEQALAWQANRAELEQRYAKEYVLFQSGEVLWHGPELTGLPSRRDLSGAKKDQAIWLKFNDPDDWEGEHLEVYQRELERTNQVSPPAGG